MTDPEYLEFHKSFYEFVVRELELKGHNCHIGTPTNELYPITDLLLDIPAIHDLKLEPSVTNYSTDVVIIGGGIVGCSECRIGRHVQGAHTHQARAARRRRRGRRGAAHRPGDGRSCGVWEGGRAVIWS